MSRKYVKKVLRACTEKTKYPTEEKAKIAAGVKTKLYKLEGLHAYDCPHCDFWHIGHKNKKASKKELDALKKRFEKQ